MPNHDDHPAIADAKVRYLQNPDDPNWRDFIGRVYVKSSQADRMTVRDNIAKELNGAAPSRKAAQLLNLDRYLGELERDMRRVGR